MSLVWWWLRLCVLVMRVTLRLVYFHCFFNSLVVSSLLSSLCLATVSEPNVVLISEQYHPVLFLSITRSWATHLYWPIKRDVGASTNSVTFCSQLPSEVGSLPNRWTSIKKFKLGDRRKGGHLSLVLYTWWCGNICFLVCRSKFS